MVNLYLLTAVILVQQDYAGQAHCLTNGETMGAIHSGWNESHQVGSIREEGGENSQ
jgi:hypothetical protein